MTRLGWICGIVVVGLSAACSSSSGGATDAATDVTSGHDTGVVHDAGRDTGHPSDAGHHDATSDAIADIGVDAYRAGINCGSLLFCDQKCGSSSSCTDACYASATGVAQGLFNAFNNCLTAACANSDASSCDTTAATGVCSASLDSCTSDTSKGPADPDGGGVVVPSMDGGASLNCGAYILCTGACALDAGSCNAACGATSTPEAKALAGILSTCLATACPTGDAGPCATQGSACNGCITQAEFSNGCASQYSACEDDKSNSPDASTSPTALQGGTLSTVLSGVNQIGGTMIVQSGYLYFIQENNSNQVSRLALVDGGVVTPLGPPQPTPVALAVDSNNAYAWNYGTFTGTSEINNDDGTVVQIPLDGSPEVTLGQAVEVFYAAPYLNAIAVDSANVYWVEGASGSDGSIVKTPIGSTTGGTKIYTGQFLPEALVTDGTNVYWASWGTFDAQGNSNNDGTISKGSVNGGTITTLASNLPAPGCMALDANNVYWTNVGKLGGEGLPAPNSGSVMQVPIGGGTVVTLASEEEVPVSIQVRAGEVYWSEYGFGSPGLILSAPIGGGTIVPLADGLHDPYSIALSPSTLYFSLYAPTVPTSTTSLVLSLTPY
jgi:hypothetical protein